MTPISIIVPGNSSAPLFTQVGFGLTIPVSADILGVQVTITGFQSDPLGTLSIAQTEGSVGAVAKPFAMGSMSGPVVIGNSQDLWGGTWTAGEVNSTAFGFTVTAINNTANPITFTASNIAVTVSYTPILPRDFTFIKTSEMTDGEVLTIGIDDAGIGWQEDVTNNPGVLCPFYESFEPDSFAVSVTQDDREFIALSDLQVGTDMPRQYNGQWVDRISQVGPGAPPSITFSSNQYGIVSITQDTSFNGFTELAAVLWSSGPTLTTAGNVLTFYFNVGVDISQILVGSNVVLSGFSGPLTGINSSGGPPVVPSIVTSVGTAIGAGNLEYPIFTVAAPSINNIDIQRRNGQAGDFGTIKLTLSTLTVSQPIPNLQVGGQLNISGATPGTWDGTWTVLFTPNASQLSINTTSLSGNVASYGYTVITGTAPTVGEQVTATGTTNGDGIFNISNATVISVAPGTFSVSIISPNISAAAEAGSAIVNGTIFEFDPGQVIADDIGTGTVVIAGGLGAGTRGAVVMFLTRNGYLTAPSPPLIFTLNEAANSLVVSNLPIGPPNVIARVVAFTGANGATQSGGGGFYFWIPTPVSVIDNGQTVTYTSTIVNDNTSTTAVFSFTDAVLLAADSITNQGSNNFQQIELGSCIGVTSYSQRLFAWGENNKIQNLLNPTFDGGIGTIIPPPGDPSTATVTYPLGWTIDPTNGSGGSVAVSPLFGDAYQITNASGSTQSALGMITQSAYQDYNKVPIIFTSTTYSVRITACNPTIGETDESDYFRRADANPLSGLWTPMGNTFPFFPAQLVNHEVTPSNIGGFGDSLYSGIVWGSDQTATAIVGNCVSAYVGVGLRMNPGPQTEYSFYVYTFGLPAGTFGWSIDYEVGPLATTILGGTAPGTITRGDTITGSVQGTALKIYRNGVLLGSTNDSNIASGSAGFILGSEATFDGASITGWYGTSFENAGSAGVTVDLYSPSLNVVFGSASMDNLTNQMQIFTLPLLTTAFSTVPQDLLIRLYANDILSGAAVQVDRIEPFPTNQPVLTTQARASYFDNFEAFDDITGNLGVGGQNQQPLRNTFTLFDNLYLIKTRSMFSTTDNGVTEPSGWTVREVSNKVGTPSIHGVDVGEGWAVIGGQSGLYLFEGGEPVKICPELDGNPGIWQSINWKYGKTLWIRNDTEQRKMYIGVPMATPNKWAPSFPVNPNPQLPNVVLVMNYKELMTSGAIAGEGPIRLTYMGDLKTYSLGRKWAIWSIQADYCDFITRPDTTQKAFFCGDTGAGKIYQQVPGLYSDDGEAMHCQYVTYRFPKTAEAQATQLGQEMLQAEYLSMLIQGEGNLDLTVYPNSLDSPYANTLLPVELDPVAPWGDTETPLNEMGNGFFFGFVVNDVDEWFELSKLTVALSVNPWSPVRGSNG